MSNKIKNIKYYSNQLDLIRINLNKISRINKLPFTSLYIFNGSNQKEELIISEELKKPLEEFLLNFIKKNKKKY